MARSGPGPASRFTLGGDKESSSDDWDRTFECTGDPAEDAFEALKLIYEIWGVDQSTIPYATSGRIDEAAIRAL